MIGDDIPLSHAASNVGLIALVGSEASSPERLWVTPLIGVLLTVLGATALVLWCLRRTVLPPPQTDASERQARALANSLEAARLWFARVAAAVPGAICTFRLSPSSVLSIPYASKAFEEVFGLSHADVAEHFDRLLEHVHPEDIAQLEATLVQSAHTLQPWRNEYRYRHPIKGDIWLEGYSMPVRDDDGAIVWHGVITDITERKRAEQAQLRASAELAAVVEIEHALAGAPTQAQVYAILADGVRRLFPDIATLVIAHYDARRELLITTTAFHDDLPLDIASIPAIPLIPHGQGAQSQVVRSRRPLIVAATPRDHHRAEAPLTGPEHQDAQSSLYVPMVALEQVLGLIQLQSRARDHFRPEDAGSLALVANTAAVCLQNIRLYELAQREIAERSQVEAILRTSERHFATIFDASPVGIAITRLSDTRIQDVNTSMLAMLGYTREQVIGRTALELGLWDSLDERKPLMDLLIASRRVANVETTCRHSAGERRTVLFSAELITLNDEQSVLIQVVDISESKRAELALRANEELYRGLMESLDSTVATVDATGRFHYMNDVAARALGGVPQDFVGKTMADLFPEPVAATQLANIRKVICEDAGLINEAPSVVQGRLRWHRTSIQPIHDEAGHVIYALINSTDIHNLKMAQQELLELNQTLEERVRQRTAEVQDLYERAPTGYHSLDAQGVIIRVNQTELDWLGYTRDELIGRPFTSILTRTSRAIFEATFAGFKISGKVQDREYELVRKDNSSFPVLLNATAIYDEAGNYVMSRSTIFDITARKAAETALRESEGQNRLLFEASPEALVLFDQRGAMARVNNAFELMTGYASARLSGRRLDELGLLSERNSAVLLAAMERARQSEEFASTEFRLTSAHGETRDIAVRVFGLQIQGMQHYLTALRDVTAERQAASALRQANSELAQAARAKDEFLANMSHELRTPLNSILGRAEALQEGIYGPVLPAQIESLRGIEESGRHLLSLINDLLDLSKIEAGRLELSHTQIWLDELCQISLLFVRELALKKRVQLKYHNPQPQLQVRADERHLKQMLVNLLSNAVKFTPSGGEVSLRVTADAVENRLELAVRDSGIGISPQNLPRLFQPFTQLDSSLSREYEGTGLGLALVRRLAEQHGGSVHASSTGVPGQGSEFTITLPYLPEEQPYDEPAPAEEPPRESALPAPGTAPLLLLAEDNELNIELITDYLGHRGYNLLIARNGLEALELAQARTPNLILMDVHMPVIDGLEVLRRLRADARLALIPVIAVTALAMVGDRERCLQAGANDYLAKPLKMKTLDEKIRQLLTPPAS